MANHSPVPRLASHPSNKRLEGQILWSEIPLPLWMTPACIFRRSYFDSSVFERSRPGSCYTIIHPWPRNGGVICVRRCFIFCCPLDERNGLSWPRVSPSPSGSIWVNICCSPLQLRARPSIRAIACVRPCLLFTLCSNPVVHGGVPSS